MKNLYFDIFHRFGWVRKEVGTMLRRGLVHIKLFPLIFILMDSCIEPLKVNLVNLAPQLVVDGMITNDPGPYEVKLFYSTQLDNTTRRPAAETGASVWILSDDNDAEKLTEVAPGVYQTHPSGIKGQIGKSYKLRIIRSNAKTYETDYDKMTPPGTLDSVFAKFDPQAIVVGDGSVLKDGLKLLVNAHGPSEETNFFRWRWMSVYEARSFPERRKEYQGTLLLPAPEPCSGYIARGKSISKVGECTCCICWTTQYGSRSAISENDYLKDNHYNEVTIDEIEVNSMLFYDKLFIEVEQLSLSARAHEFWDLVAKQENAAGNLFQPNAVRVKGNVNSLSDPNENVLGIFSVSGITRKTIFLDRSIIPYTLPPIDSMGYDCRSVFQNATIEKPPYW